MLALLFDLLGATIDVIWLCRRGEDSGCHPAVAVVVAVMIAFGLLGMVCQWATP